MPWVGSCGDLQVQGLRGQRLPWAGPQLTLMRSPSLKMLLMLSSSSAVLRLWRNKGSGASIRDGTKAGSKAASVAHRASQALG